MSSDFGTPMVFNRVSGDAAMPSAITVYVASFPLQNGRYRRDYYIPAFASVTTTATTQIYEPANKTIGMAQPSVKGPANTVSRAGAAQTVGFMDYSATASLNGRITFATTATTAVIDPFMVSSFYSA